MPIDPFTDAGCGARLSRQAELQIELHNKAWYQAELLAKECYRNSLLERILFCLCPSAAAGGCLNFGSDEPIFGSDTPFFGNDPCT